MLLREQNFGAAIPESNHLVSVAFDWQAKGAGQAEVGKLDSLAVLADKKILRFKVAMEDSVGVEENKRLQYLVEKTLSLGGG